MYIINHMTQGNMTQVLDDSIRMWTTNLGMIHVTVPTEHDPRVGVLVWGYKVNWDKTFALVILRVYLLHIFTYQNTLSFGFIFRLNLLQKKENK